MSEYDMSYEPKLQEEVDPQDWQVHRQLTTPQGEINEGSEPTCLNVKVSNRKWKNQYAEGHYTHVSAQMKTQWADSDYEEMSLVPCEVRDNSQLRPLTESIVFPAVEVEGITAEEIESVIRVQISMKRKGTDAKGRYSNFELHRVSLDEIGFWIRKWPLVYNEFYVINGGSRLPLTSMLFVIQDNEYRKSN